MGGLQSRGLEEGRPWGVGWWEVSSAEGTVLHVLAREADTLPYSTVVWLESRHPVSEK